MVRYATNLDATTGDASCDRTQLRVGAAASIPLAVRRRTSAVYDRRVFREYVGRYIMVLKLPPPPQLPVSFGGFGQQLNRWLLEIQSILNSQGTIDPSSVDGLVALIAQVAALTTQVATLDAEVVTLTASVATNTADIATNTAAIAVLQANAVILNGNGAPGVGLGSPGDLYINNTGSAGTNLYANIAGTWAAFA